MSKEQSPESPEDRSARFKREAQKLIDAGDPNPLPRGDRYGARDEERADRRIGEPGQIRRLLKDADFWGFFWPAAALAGFKTSKLGIERHIFGKLRPLIRVLRLNLPCILRVTNNN